VEDRRIHATRKEYVMAPTRQPAASASAKTASITPSQLRLLAQRQHEEWLLDEALRETFPASDPIAVTAVAETRVDRDAPDKVG
jgi:hypothetical protein